MAAPQHPVEIQGPPAGPIARLTPWVIIAVSVSLLALRLGESVVGRVAAWQNDRQQADALRANEARIWSLGNVVGPDNVRDSAVMFTDYECPFCARQEMLLTAGDLERLKLSVRYVNLPLEEIHQFARLGASIAECAGEIGQFAPVHYGLFRTGEWRDVRRLRAWLIEAGVPDEAATQVEYCVNAGDQSSALAEQLQLAASLGIRSTPSWILGGRVVTGVIGAAALADSLAEWRQASR